MLVVSDWNKVSRSFNANTCLIPDLGFAIQFAMIQRVAEGHLLKIGSWFLMIPQDNIA